MTRKGFALIIAFLSLMLLPLGGARAMTVSPVLFDFEIAPGSGVQDKIRLFNDTNQEETYSLSVENFVASGEEGEQQYLSEQIPTDLASWVHMDQPSIKIPPGGSAEFPFAVTIPNNAEPGGHYATVFYTKGARDDQGNGVGVSEKLGVLLLVRVPGDIKELASVESFRVANGGLLSRLPANLELRIKNSGSVHIRPMGTLVIRNTVGSVVTRLDANPKKSAVLPNSIRRIESGWSKSTDIPKGGFWGETQNEWKNFAFGRYTATVEATYGASNAKLPMQQVSFWVIPWRLMLIALGLLIVLISIMKLYNAALVKSALKGKQSK